jgi:hypothetical protein
MQKPIQFDWRRHWSKKVAPHLDKEIVQAALDYGMRLLDPEWQRGDPPFLLGGIPLFRSRSRVVTGTLTWYQVWNRCHFIAFFSMAVGVLNYPHLDWRFVSCDRHTVPVGYGPDGEPSVVMDILLFDRKTAEESIARAQQQLEGAKDGAWWDQVFLEFIGHFVPLLRASSAQDAGSLPVTDDPHSA